MAEDPLCIGSTGDANAIANPPNHDDDDDDISILLYFFLIDKNGF